LNTDQFVSLRKYNSLSLAGGGIFSDEYDIGLRAKGLMLPNITVKARKKSAMQELEDRYVSSEFSGGAEQTIDLTTEQAYGANIFYYLQSRVAGLRVEQKVGSYQVYYRSNRNFMGGSPMTIFLDEIPVNPDMLLSITPSEIALVKVFSHFIGGPGNSPNGVLAIYTKKGDDLFKNNDEQPNNRFLYHGYSIIKQFYSPDYTVNTSDIKSFDHRITLLWIPDIFISAINPKIPIVFFNNERTRRFRIQVEGITKNGKIVCIEKIVGAEALNKPF